MARRNGLVVVGSLGPAEVFNDINKRRTASTELARIIERMRQLKNTLFSLANDESPGIIVLSQDRLIINRLNELQCSEYSATQGRLVIQVVLFTVFSI